jgi:hypothetical protein
LPLPLSGQAVADLTPGEIANLLIDLGVPNVSHSNGKRANLEAYSQFIDSIRKPAADGAVAKFSSETLVQTRKGKFTMTKIIKQDDGSASQFILLINRLALMRDAVGTLGVRPSFVHEGSKEIPRVWGVRCQ